MGAFLPEVPRSAGEHMAIDPSEYVNQRFPASSKATLSMSPMTSVTIWIPGLMSPYRRTTRESDAIEPPRHYLAVAMDELLSVWENLREAIRSGSDGRPDGRTTEDGRGNHACDSRGSRGPYHQLC